MIDSPSVIAVDHVSKEFRNGRNRRSIRALDGVSLDVRPGEIFSLLGPNGAGKTTLIKILLGFVRATSGTATLLGFPAGDRRGRRRVGYLPEHLRIPRHQTARTALDFYGQLSGMTRREIRAKAGRLLNQVGLGDRDRESVKQFSKGMLQRLGLAQAMLHDPDLIILDEPTDGLDPIGRSEIRKLLLELRDQGRAVFLNSHLLQEVELICDRVAILDRGQLKFVGRLDEIASNANKNVRLTLNGSREAIVKSLPPESWDQTDWSADDGSVEIVVPAETQHEVDEWVDRLRANQVSVCQLSWQKTTLEDAFLQFVGMPSSDPSDQPTGNS